MDILLLIMKGLHQIVGYSEAKLESVSLGSGLPMGMF